MNTGYREVVDADLSGYFDSIPHLELMKSVARRVSDGRVLRLIKMWLEAPVEETDERGRKRRTTRNKDDGRGTPQGAPISPLLSNLYMRRFVLGWKRLGLAERLQARIVNYADDFVICCRGTAQEALAATRRIMEKLKLTVNDAKTHVCRVPEERFDFLGYTIGRCWSTATGKSYIGTRPSAKRIQRICREISEATSRSTTSTSEHEKVEELNGKLQGWANYFRLGQVSKARRAVDMHTRLRVRQWLRRKHKRRGANTVHFPDEYLYRVLGLVRMECLVRPELHVRVLPWARV